VALTLAGHTHGGQVALPILGRPVVPSRYGQRYAYGLVVEDGRVAVREPGHRHQPAARALPRPSGDLGGDARAAE
jgi:hypothetical protein